MIEKKNLIRIADWLWEVPQSYRSDMRAPARLYADERFLANALEDRSIEQLINTATLPGIVGRALAMPDIHQGYGFPIGGVVAVRYAGRRDLARRRGLRHQLRRAPAGLRPARRRGAPAPERADLVDLRRTCPAASAAPAASSCRLSRWTACWPRAPAGPSAAATACRDDLDHLEVARRHRSAPTRSRSASAPANAAATSSARSARATTSWRSGPRDADLRRRRWPTPSACSRGRSRSMIHSRLARAGPPGLRRLLHTHAEDGGAIPTSSCPTASWPARRSTRRRAEPTWRPWRPRRTSRGPTGR